jgi:hypothetical protein
MFIKKDQNKLEIYLKNKILQQNFFLFISTPLIKNYHFFKKKDIILNQLNFIDIFNMKAPFGVQSLNFLKNKKNSFIYIIKTKKTIYKQKNNFYFNKINYFLKLWFIKKSITLSHIWYKNLL